MSTDKKLILLSLLLVLVTLLLAPSFLKEKNLIEERDAQELAAHLTYSFFYPHTQTERIAMLEEHIENMKTLQERVAKSFLAKRYVNYDEQIAKREADLKERKESLGHQPDCITFSTQGLHHISSFAPYSKDEHLELATLIDSFFPEEVLGTAIFLFEEEGLINLSPFDPFDTVAPEVFQSFVQKASAKLGNLPLSLQVGSPGSGHTDLYFSESLPPLTTDSLMSYFQLTDPTHLEWGYEGMLPTHCHVIWTDIDAPGLQTQECHILKAAEDHWEITDTIASGDFHIKEGKIETCDTIVEAGLVELIANHVPEFKEKIEALDRSFSSGKAGYLGVAKFLFTLSDEGKVDSKEFLSFESCEGWPPLSGRTFFKKDLAELGELFLADIL